MKHAPTFQVARQATSETDFSGGSATNIGTKREMRFKLCHTYRRWCRANSSRPVHTTHTTAFALYSAAVLHRLSNYNLYFQTMPRRASSNTKATESNGSSSAETPSAPEQLTAATASAPPMSACTTLPAPAARWAHGRVLTSGCICLSGCGCAAFRCVARRCHRGRPGETCQVPNDR